MAQSIFEYVKAKEVLDYARRLDPATFLGLSIFAPRMVSELEYEYLKGAGGVKANMMAEVVAWESPAPMAPHEGLAKVEGELPPIKQKSRFSEKEVLKLFNPRSTRERQEVISRLYNDVQARVDGVHARLNWIIMQSLAEGQVVFNSEGTKLTVSWGLDGTQIVIPNPLWSVHDTSTPIADIQALQAVIQSLSGSVPDVAITSTTIIGHLLANEGIKKAMFGTAEVDRIVTLPALNAFFTSVGLPEVFAYDEKAKIVGANYGLTTTRFYPENRFTMFPRGEVLGETLYGPTAEAIRDIGAQEAPGIYAEVFETRDPVNVWTYAVASAFPTFPGADMVGILKPIA